MSTLQPEDFWSFKEWLLRPGAFLESAILQGISVFVLVILAGLLLGYLVSAVRYGPGEAFYAVAGTIRDLLTRDLPGTAPRRIGALARLAFKEAIRRKVLLVFGLFMIGLLVAGWVLDMESDDPARLYIVFVLTTTNYLILLLGIFLSCFSLPADIKSRTIYTIVTKPVRPTEVILGRILGFTAVGTMLLLPMALASYGFVVRGLDHSHEVAADKLEEGSGGEVRGETTFDRRHQHSFELDADGLGVTSLARGHRHVIQRQGDQWIVGPPEGALRARVPRYGSILFLDRQGNEAAGIDVGYEHRAGGYSSGGISRFIGRTIGARRFEHGYIEGGTLCAAIVTFDNVRPEIYPGDALPLEMRLRVFRTFKADIVTPIRGTITLRNPEKPEVESEPIGFLAKEYEIDELSMAGDAEGGESSEGITDRAEETRKGIPIELEGKVGDQAQRLNVFKDLVSSTGQLQVVIRCLDRGQYLGLTKSDIYLKPAESSFAWNLTKAYLCIWLQMVMVISLGVMCSTLLSGPVGMIATAVLVLMGFMADTVHDTRYYMDRGENMGGGPVESLIRMVRQDAQTTDLDLPEIPKMIVRGVDNVVVYSEDAFVTALPNLPKMVATAEYVAGGFDIPGGLLMRHFVATFGYVLLALFAGYFFFKTREIAA